MSIFTIQHTPAEIVNMFPKASDVFKEHKINFCCKGDQALHIVLSEKDIPGKKIMEELNTLYEKWREQVGSIINWEDKSLAELVDQFEHDHAHIQEELLPLENFVTRVFHVHGEDQSHLMELYGLYNDLLPIMEEHMSQEEQEVFPLIRELENHPSEKLAERLLEAIHVIEVEHEQEVNLFNRIRKITNAFKPPVGACNTYRMTYARLADLEENTLQHIHLENNVLSKRLRRELSFYLPKKELSCRLGK